MTNDRDVFYTGSNSCKFKMMVVNAYKTGTKLPGQCCDDNEKLPDQESYESTGKCVFNQWAMSRTSAAQRL